MICIENMDFGYQKKREVFSGLNLSLTGGHIYGLLGKNGAGKTTLLKLIGGLLFPLRGRIEVCDAIPRLRKPSFLSDIFFIPEEICLPDMIWCRIKKPLQNASMRHIRSSLTLVCPGIARQSAKPLRIIIGEPLPE